MARNTQTFEQLLLAQNHLKVETPLLAPKENPEESDFINYIGKIVFEDMYSLYQKYDVFVLPSHREGFSTVALEAAANGMPLIITNAPGCIECFNSNGFSFNQKISMKRLWRGSLLTQNL